MSEVDLALEDLQARAKCECNVSRFFQQLSFRRWLSRGDASGWWQEVSEQGALSENDRERLAEPLRKAGEAICALSAERRDPTAERFILALASIE